MSTIIAAGLGTLTASNTATIVDPQTPANGIARLSPLVSFAPVTASGTSVDFVGIPSWARRIIVVFNGISMASTSSPLLQLGSGSVTTSGYLAYASYAGSGTGGVTYSNGFGTSMGNAAALMYGEFYFTLSTGNTWVHSHITAVNASGTYYMMNGGGNIALPGVLDRVRITSSNGTDTFDTGTLTCYYH